MSKLLRLFIAADVYLSVSALAARQPLSDSGADHGAGDKAEEHQPHGKRQKKTPHTATFEDFSKRHWHVKPPVCCYQCDQNVDDACVSAARFLNVCSHVTDADDATDTF